MSTMTNRLCATPLALAAAVLALSACAPTHPNSPLPPSSAITSATTTASSSTSTRSAGAAQTGSSNGQTYTVTISTNDARVADPGSWHTETAQLNGGDPAVTAAFNKASEASTRQQVERAIADNVGVPNWNLREHPDVKFRPTAIGAVLVGVYYADHAAHPVNYVSTIVIDSRTARPITLNTLFTNESDGLARLSEQTKLIFPPSTATPPAHRWPTYLAPRPARRTSPTGFRPQQGMEIHFADYQFGHGLPVITVPWTTLADVLAPDMTALAH
jgi:hypothetical protein